VYRGGILSEAMNMKDVVESVLETGVVTGQPVDVLPWSGLFFIF
jgi:hypothetical protein